MITDNRKKRIYKRIEDRKIKMLLGKAFKDMGENEVATAIQNVVRLYPATRRFDEKTFKILNDNKDNEYFRKQLSKNINSRRC